MTRYFNTSGTCNPAEHYMLAPEPRLPEARELIADRRFFVVHAPRRTGRTTTLVALARDLRAGGYAAIRLSCESAVIADAADAEEQILSTIRAESAANLPPDAQPPAWPDAAPGTRLRDGLRAWARVCPGPLVLAFDEIDSLTGAPLVSVLSQLRDGYTARDDAPFVSAAVLCGLRDAGDYRLAQGRDTGRFGTSSPFSISAKSVRLADFTREQVAELYAQHTAETGQEFTAEALDAAFEYTQGQPWLVNALGFEITREMRVPAIDTITAEHVEEARERLVRARATHLDSLAAKLHENRIRKIIEPIIAGELIAADATYDDDVSYARDLGLVGPGSPLAIANPIYADIIVRVLGQNVWDSLTSDPRSFLLPDCQLDFRKVLEEFAEWWQEHAEVLLRGQVYDEAAAMLIFLAYLTRIVNGGGFVDCEYGVGRLRMDVAVRMPWIDDDGNRQTQSEGVELKVWRARRANPLAAGMRQLDRYLKRLSLDSGTLIIFGRRPAALADQPDPEFTTEQTPAGRTVTVLRV